MTLPEAVKLAMRLLEQNRLAEAEAIFAAVLNADPHCADALHFMGILRCRQERADEAVALIRQAIAAAPDYAEAHHNLGNILRAMGRFQEAQDAFGRMIELAPNLSEAHLNLADVLRRSGHGVEALPFYVRALELEPTLAEAHFQLGRTYYRLGMMPQGAAAFRKWLEMEPDNPVARHMVAACGGAITPARASDGYVRCEFDDFADTFDDVMTKIGYNAPEHLATAIATHIQPSGPLDILDAGCGTGRCGALVRRWSRRLTGVDLSPAMLEQAGKRNVYSELVEAELTAFLEHTDRKFDLILSADTFIYFGSLSAVFRGVGRCLRPGGYFVFSVEHHEAETCNEGFFLHPHGRYSQREGYVRQCLQESGLTVDGIEPATIRLELKEPVAGLIVTAALPHAP